ncbi:hypothetical protein GCM10009593_26450 [Microlunatus antarcticus]
MGGPGPAAVLDELAQHLSELAPALEAEDDTQAVLDDLVAAAVAQIPGVDEGSISIVLARKDVTSQSPSSDLPRRVDALQTEVGEGPCRTRPIRRRRSACLTWPARLGGRSSRVARGCPG